MNETVLSNWDATNNWGSGILSAPFNVTNTIEHFYDDFGRDAGYAFNGVRQSTLAYDPSTGRLASMQIFSEESNHHSSTSTSHFNYYIWDPTEPVATRPLVWNSSTVQPFNSSTFFYTHDGNKNVSEVIASDGALAAHYEYAPFGALTAQRGTSAAPNPWRFSSEYAEDDTTTVYYNYRHYESATGRWLQRDLIFEKGGISLYCNSKNRVLNFIDYFENNDMYSRWTLQNAGHFLYSSDEHVYAYLKCCQEAIVVHGDKGSAQPSVVGVFKTDCPIK